MSRASTKYDRLAHRYDARWPSYISKSVQRTLAHVKPRPGERLLDVGCGTGELLAAIARQDSGATLIGVDPSPAMLAVAREKLPAASFLEGTAESIPVESSSVDWLVTTSAFHYVADPLSARREFRRVLRPGGTLVLTDWSADFVTMRLRARWSKLLDPAIRHVYTAIELQALLVAAGFYVRVETYKLNWYWGLMTVHAVKAG